MLSPTFKATAPRPGVWSPAQAPPEPAVQTVDPEIEEKRKKIDQEPIVPVWTPKSAQASPVAERKEYRPVNFESPTLPRKKFIQEEKSEAPPPWQQSRGEKPSELKSSCTSSSALPRAVNPTVTLLQKAREGQIPRGPQYFNSTMPDQDANEYHSNEIYFPTKSDSERPSRIELGPRKPIAGIGPTTKEGIPLVLRSEVTEDNKERWYKRMYESLHRPEKDADYVTVKYRTTPHRRGLYGYHAGSAGGYQSEPEQLATEDPGQKYATLDRRRTQRNKENEVLNVTLPKRAPSRFGAEQYKNQPGRIENYQPGHSSITDLEANKWWDEVLEIFDRWLEANPGADGQNVRLKLADAIYRRQAEKSSQPVHKTHSPVSFMTYALKESGYESDPQHIFKRREDDLQTPLSPQEQKEAYKTIQKGGEVPLRGLRKPAPERPKDDTEIEYFPLSPTLTRIRVHKQNITPVNSFPFPFPYQYPILPVGVCSSYSQIQLYPTPEPSCTKRGSLYQFSRSSDGGDQRVKLQTIGEQAESLKIVPKPRSSVQKRSPVYENLPVTSKTSSAEAQIIDKSNETTSQGNKPATFADLKRIAPSLIPKSTTKTKGKTAKTKSTKTKVPLSESTHREKPLSKIQKRLKTLPENLRKRRIDSKTTPRKRPKQELQESLAAFLEAELGPGYLSPQSSEDPVTEGSGDTMQGIYDSSNPNFAGKREADYPPYRSRSFSPENRRKVPKPPSPPKRQSSKNASTLRMWSKMMVTYPYHRSRIDSYDSNVRYLQDRLQRKLDGSRSESPSEQFGDDIETVRSVRKSKDGQMSIKTNRYLKISRPVSAGPPLRPVYDQNGRRVLSEPRKPASPTPKKASEATKSKKPDTVVKSSYSVRNASSQEDDKRKSVKVTVAISAKGKEPLRKSSVASPSQTLRKPYTKGSSPSPSVSSCRSGVSGRSFSERGSSVTSPRLLSPTSTTSRISSPGRTLTPTASISSVNLKKPETKKTTSLKTPVTTVKDTKKVPKTLTITKSPGKKIISQIGVTKTKDTTKKKNGNGSPKSKKSVEPVPKLELQTVEQGQQIRSDNFFQNLFLRVPPEKKVVTVERTSSVIEKARRYQRSIERRDSNSKPEPSNLNLVQFYLTQKRPVSCSKFKHLDRELSLSRSPSPYSRSHSSQVKLSRFDSGSQFGDDLISFSPDLKIRSLSEPPIKHKAVTDGRRSPRVLSPPSRPKPLEVVCDPRRRNPRARSAGEVEEHKTPNMSSAQSSSTLYLNDNPEYQAYVFELLHSTKKSERFRELHKFYASLERMAELEKTASIGDLRPRLKNEEIIDYDRWKMLRTKERAEAELKTLVGKLTEIQKEKDLVFRTADVDALRWKGDRGLRAKERSVEDLKEQFIRISREEAEGWKREFHQPKDNYKPFWRGNSIVNLASNLNTTITSHRGRPVTSGELEKIEAAKNQITRKFTPKQGRAWSSLSNEQVSALKSQLSEIYTQELKKKNGDSHENFEIAVPEDSNVLSPGEKNLFVRCHSLLTNEETLAPMTTKKEEKKSKSISSIPGSSDDDFAKVGPLQLSSNDESEKKKKTKKAGVTKSRSSSSVSSQLSESDKKKISMTLSKEVLEKVSKSPRGSPVLARETLGAVASTRHRRLSPETVGSPRTCYSFDLSDGGKSKSDFLLVLTPTEKDVEKAVEDWANGNAGQEMQVQGRGASSASTVELESAGSASSVTSVKTVIKKPINVLKKVEYFEDLSQDEESLKIEKPRAPRSHSAPESLEPRHQLRPLTPAYSLENISEILGEERKFATVPIQPVKKANGKNSKSVEREEEFRNIRNLFESRNSKYSVSPSSYRYGDSVDSLFSFRSRSISPDPTKYYRAYLRMARGGAVRKICNKFESLEDLLDVDEDFQSRTVKKSASDPELTRDMLSRYGTDPLKTVVRGQETGDVQWLKSKYEDETRGRSRHRRSPIPRAPFTVSDRYMPRINVISKTAELQLQKLAKSRAEELPASPEPFYSLTEYTKKHGGYYYIGEVEKLKRHFERLQDQERMSLLGQMYTSTPDVSELRDIAPYLGCTWVAHQHPEVVKTASSSPELLEKRKTSPTPDKLKPRPRSSSPVRHKQLPSILKHYPSGDVFANQKFDPTIHRPKYRYQPEPVTYSYDRRLRWAGGGETWWRHWNRPTVTFKGLETVNFFGMGDGLGALLKKNAQRQANKKQNWLQTKNAIANS